MPAVLLRGAAQDGLRAGLRDAELPGALQDVIPVLPQAWLRAAIQGVPRAGLRDGLQDVPRGGFQAAPQVSLQGVLRGVLQVWQRGLLRDDLAPDVPRVRDGPVRDVPQGQGESLYAHRQAAEPDGRY